VEICQIIIEITCVIGSLHRKIEMNIALLNSDVQELLQKST